ncbi:MAG: iron chelate uptake ABC transporter family permease subunit, partial [Candidatus Bathyarchaeia archaeon]
ILLSGIMMYAFARDLNLMLLGDEEARHLGVSVEKTKKLLILFASLATATSVSLSGIIGFVGLIVPHITRILIGPDHRILIPASMLLGGIFLMICDALARIVMLPAELPVGIITALSGGPFFIYLLRKKKGSYAM